MNLSSQLANHLHQIHFGGNWADSNLELLLADITWKEATTKVGSLNTVAVLTFHINYYVEALLQVLKGEKLKANDKFSFDLPPIKSVNDWESLIEKSLRDAKECVLLIDKLAESKMEEDFTDKKYGTYFRNIQGTIEHSHYHLGQIALIKKMIRMEN